MRHHSRARAAGAIIVVAAALAACHHAGTSSGPSPVGSASPAAVIASAFPSSWRFKPGIPATFAEHAMVVSMSRPASEAGVEIMKEGGNAVDAAVATGFALAVTYPAAGNIGGGGFMTIRMADGRDATLDFREVAPLAATHDMYVENGKLTDKSRIGYLASGVPGSVAGLAAALEKYGTMPLAKVMAPAIRLARQGYVIDSTNGGGRRNGNCNSLIARFEGKDLFCPGGHALAPGTRFTQPDLARTLELIAAEGPKAFYDGAIADSIAADEQRGGGIITKEDLRRYTPVWRQPIQSTYRGYSLITMPPSSSGGITMSETLNILETFAPLPPPGSTEYSHLVAEALRRSFTDRNEKLGDPAFVHVPLDQLTDKAYARTLAEQIDPHHASKTPVFKAKAEEMNTTHYSVMDAAGNAVATTTTLNGGFGSGVWIRGGGFFMNNEMDDFAAQPGTPNMFGLVQGEANAVEPGKRMLSAMSPTIVLDPQGKVLLVTGAAGGPTIITTTMQVILNVIEFHMSLSDAMHAPRLHHQAIPDQLDFEPNGLTTAVQDSLKAMGHALGTRQLATANSIMRVPGGLQGVGEPRSGGVAVGY
ncbi:MAG TPA: gamma-glutamyltransferase [Gemmatimonadaceae bacterium]|nr:gamma-glutamyltransferase [Gemmatimonadaceae bacterium]